MKLKYSDVRKASEMYNDGASLKTLAIVFDCSEPTMGKYLRAYERYGITFWRTDRKEKESYHSRD